MALHAVDWQDRQLSPPPSTPPPPMPPCPPAPPPALSPPQPPPGQIITINTAEDVSELTVDQPEHRQRLFSYDGEAFVFDSEKRIRFPLEALDNGTNEEWSVSLSFKTTSSKGAVDANHLKSGDCRQCDEMCLGQVEQGRDSWLGGVGLASWGGPGPGGAYGLSLRQGNLSLGWATSYEHCSKPTAECSVPSGGSSCAPLYKSRLAISSSALLHDGTWHHVVATKAADGTVTLVVDGAVQGTGSVSSEGLSPPTAPPSRAPSARSAARSAGWLTLGDLCLGGSGKVKKQSNEVPCSSDAATEMYDGRMKNIAIYDQDVTASFISPPRSPPHSPSPPPAPPAQPETKLTAKPPPPPLSGGAIAAIVFGVVAGLVLLVLFVLRFRRQSMQLGKMQAPRHRLDTPPPRCPLPLPALTLWPRPRAWPPHTHSASDFWQMELTQLRSRSIKLSSDDEPTIGTNTRSAPPYEHEPEEPIPTVSVELDEPPLTTLKVTRVAKPDRGLDTPALAA